MQQGAARVDRFNMASSRRHLLFLILASTICLLLATACYGVSRAVFPPETRAPDSFPDTDLVFTTSSGVGFVNADGSNLSYLPLTAKLSYGMEDESWRPVITGDHRTMIVKMADKFWHVYNPTLLVLWTAGDLPVPCLPWPGQQMAYLSSDQQDIFIQTKQGTARYRLSSCGTNDAPIETYDNVSGIPSPDLKYIVYVDIPSAIPSDDRFIILRELASGKERRIGIGDYPAWSRDGHWVAYTGKDGLYVFNVLEGEEAQLAVVYRNPYPGHENSPTFEGGDYPRIPPEVSWSPDGKWLVYHRWTGTKYETGVDPYYNAIYKLNIETGEEIKILDGGMYPYWRWPAEEP